MTGGSHTIGDVSLIAEDVPGSRAASWIARELRSDIYGLTRIEFAPGDVVLDIGAHVGMVSMWLAAKHANLRIVALEPDPDNFRCLTVNLAMNGVTNVAALHCAVTADGRPFPLYRPPGNSGGAGGYYRRVEGYTRSVATSVTLDSLLERYAPRGCKLLKIDCEGAEHEILLGAQRLASVEHLVLELHVNAHLQDLGYSADRLIKHLDRHFPSERRRITVIRMGH
jgi:FkbM family methyltransferase